VWRSRQRGGGGGGAVVLHGRLPPRLGRAAWAHRRRPPPSAASPNSHEGAGAAGRCRGSARAAEEKGPRGRGCSRRLGLSGHGSSSSGLGRVGMEDARAHHHGPRRRRMSCSSHSRSCSEAEPPATEHARGGECAWQSSPARIKLVGTGAVTG
jgi:hypothetical protein